MANSDSASTSLAPGFRFHPTDEELVSYYLKRKVCGIPFRFDAITEIDIYKVEPWDLPGLSKLKSRDLEWYFFSGLDRKYGNGSRTNRATGKGYWKTTGKDRPVRHKSRLVGMKKTLVYHMGRAPHGERTNWVMHEYKLVDETLGKAGYSLEGIVLCRIFQKSGVGPKNGEKYGAPLVEEDWENEDVGAMVPGEVCFEEPFNDDDAYIEQIDLDQNLNLQLPGDILPFNQFDESSSIYVEDFIDTTGSEERSIAAESEYNGVLRVMDDHKFFDLPDRANIVKNEHMALPSDETIEISTNCLCNGSSSGIIGGAPSSDNIGDVPLDDGQFLDSIDFLVPGDENPLDFGSIEPFLDGDIDIAQYLSFDTAELMGSDTDQLLQDEEDLENATWHLPLAIQQPSEAIGDNIASPSAPAKDVPISKPSKSDMHYPFLGQASRLLSNIPAPAAFASEFPSKDLTKRLNAVQPSSSVHVTAGMIRIREMTVGSSSLQFSFDKTGNVNILLSLDLPEYVGRTGLDSLSGVFSSKMASAVSRGWTRFMFFWVLVFAVSFKVGSCIFAK